MHHLSDLLYLQRIKKTFAPAFSLSFEPTRLGTTRSLTPIKSFFSSRSFWKFSILFRLPWSCSTTSDTSARAATDTSGVREYWRYMLQLQNTYICLYVHQPERSTSAVPEIHMSCRVVFAQALQDLLVVTEAVQRPQDEDIEGDVAHLLQLKVPAETLQPVGPPGCLLQLQQHFRLLMQVCSQGLWTTSKQGTYKYNIMHNCNCRYAGVRPHL